MTHNNTPVWKPEEIPTGRTAHIGEGQWMWKCEHCDRPTVTEGIPSLAFQQRHNWEEHGIRSQAILP